MINKKISKGFYMASDVKYEHLLSDCPYCSDQNEANRDDEMSFKESEFDVKCLSCNGVYTCTDPTG